MDGQSYLNEISMANRPAKKSKANFLKSKFFLVGMIGAIGLLLIFILGMVLGGGKTGIKEQSITLKLRLNNVASVVSTYQPDVKSSVLRSNSASLHSVLVNTNESLGTYLEEKYNFKRDKDAPEKIANVEDAHMEDLSNELFTAKINGLLDRTFTYKMIYEISLILTMERKINSATSDSNLKSIMDTSIQSLENLYNAFNEFSEAN